MAAIISLLGLVPLIAWVYPLLFVHETLAEKGEGSKLRKAMLVIGISIGGYILALLVQFILYWILDQFISWWYA